MIAALLAFQISVQVPALGGQPWVRHVIDGTSKGADGVRFADVNRDGRRDITTGWEQGGVVRAYLHPGAKVREPWPMVTVGQVASPEDAVFVDLDGDGAVDVVSSCEGKQRTMFVHWAPKDPAKYLDSSAWTTEAIPATKDLARWMYAVPLQVDGKHGVDLIAGAKDAGAAIGWLRAPANPRDLAAWTWHPLRDVGWTMSILATDMDGDGDSDILFSDRRKERSGVAWLENPGVRADQTQPWREHAIGSAGSEVMFLDQADYDGDGDLDIAAAVKPRAIHVHTRQSRDGRTWKSEVVPVPEVTGTAKSVRIADIDRDGRMDLVWSTEQAKGVSGVLYLRAVGGGRWEPRDISGAAGVKYDWLALEDLDSDGDLDVITTEEVTGLGVIWYENPSRPHKRVK